MGQSDALGLLLDQTQDKIALVDDDGRYTYLNAAVERILGYEPSALLGEVVFDYVHPDDVDDVRRSFERTIRQDAFTEVTAEYRHRTADGEWVWLESHMSNLTDEALDGYVVSSRDVSDRVRAELQQAETAARLEEITAIDGDVLWMFNADWSEVLFVNPAYEEIFGGSIEEVRDDPSAFLDTVHPDDVPRVEDAMTCLAAGKSVDMEYRVNPGEGYRRWVWVQAEPISENGEVVRITGFARDITDRRRRERQLVVMDNLLRHNLRNDLNVMLGQAELVEEAFPEAAEHTAVVRRVGQQLLQSAEKEREIIDLITEQQGREPIDLRHVVEEAVETIRERYPHALVEVGEQAPIVVRGRPELQQAAVELLENAIRHSDAERPRVMVSVRQTGQHAEFVVEDEAAPLPSVEADVLRGSHDMTDVYHSSGLGLWLVYWAVELSNGHLTVHTDEGGNRISVSLPVEIDSKKEKTLR